MNINKDYYYDIRKFELRIRIYNKDKKFLLTYGHWELLFIIIKYSQKKKNRILKKNIYIYTLFPKGLTQIYKILKIKENNICL